MLVNPQEERILRDFDRELHRYLPFFNLLKVLAPTNTEEEYAIFRQKKGMYNPQFRYNFPDQETIHFMEAHVQKIRSSYADQSFQSPIAQLLKEKLSEYEDKLSLIKAYIQQDFKQIALYNQKLFGKISQAYIQESEAMLEKAKTQAPVQSLVLSRQEVIQYIRTYLDEHDFKEVKIQERLSMPYRVAVVYTSRNIILRLGKFASLDQVTIDAVIAHEIQTHIQRYLAGKQSGWLILKYGTSGSSIDEEGLAVYNAIYVHKKQNSDYIHVSMYRKYLITSYASDHSFAQTAEYLRTLFPQKSFYAVYNGVLRCKMGIMDTSLQTPGSSFDRDGIFLAGYHRIQEWVKNGGNVEKLSIGKIKIDDIGVLN